MTGSHGRAGGTTDQHREGGMSSCGRRIPVSVSHDTPGGAGPLPRGSVHRAVNVLSLHRPPTPIARAAWYGQGAS